MDETCYLRVFSNIAKVIKYNNSCTKEKMITDISLIEIADIRCENNQLLIGHNNSMG